MQEINIQYAASVEGLSPLILQIVVDIDKVGFIMEKMKITLRDKIIQISQEMKKKDDTKKEQISNLIISACENVKLLHNIDIIHGDLHLNNFMINENDDLVIIDFGESEFCTDSQKKDYSVPFEDVYNAKSTEWIKNPKLWNYYYSPDKLFSPYARDSWVPPDLRRI